MENVSKKQLARRRRYFKHRSFSLFSVKEKIIMGVIFAIFAIYAITLLYPFLYTLINAFKDPTEFAGKYNPATDTRTNPNYFWFTLHPTFKNFISAFKEITVGSTSTNIGEMFFYTIILSVGETFVSMAMTCCAAYVIAKYKFVGAKFLYTVVIISSFIPTVAALPSLYKLMFTDLKLAGTYFGMIVLNASAFGGSFLYIHSYFKAVPWSFAESAMMDGASDFKVFYQIMIPLAKNGILTFTIMKFLGFWNDYWFPSLFYSNHPTIAVGIAGINNTSNSIPFICAAMVLAIIPILIFYAIFQKQLMQNTIGGGLKE